MAEHEEPEHEEPEHEEPDDEEPDDEGELSEPAGLGVLGNLFAQFEVATERLESAAAEARAAVVEGSAAGGAVVIQLTGELDALSVHIDRTLVDPSDVAMLEDSVLAALRDALGQVAELQQEMAGALGDGELDLSALLGSLGGLSLPNLGNLGSLGNLADLGMLGLPEHMPGGGELGGLGALLGGFGGLRASHDAHVVDADDEDGEPDEAAGKA